MFAAADPFLASTVTVRTRTGAGANGDVHAAPVPATVFVEDGRKLVRDTTGEQVVSETTLYADPAAESLFATGSLVTVRGRETTVLLVKAHLIGDPDVDHVEINLA